MSDAWRSSNGIFLLASLFILVFATTTTLGLTLPTPSTSIDQSDRRQEEQAIVRSVPGFLYQLRRRGHDLSSENEDVALAAAAADPAEWYVVTFFIVGLSAATIVVLVAAKHGRL